MTELLHNTSNNDASKNGDDDYGKDVVVHILLSQTVRARSSASLPQKPGAADHRPAAGEPRERCSQSRRRAALARQSRCPEPSMGFLPSPSWSWFSANLRTRTANESA